MNISASKRSKLTERYDEQDTPSNTSDNETSFHLYENEPQQIFEENEEDEGEDDDDDSNILSQTDNPPRHVLQIRNSTRNRKKQTSSHFSMHTNISDACKGTSASPILAQRRYIFCNIHGHIEFEPVLVAIIDTPQFQRLRGLQQLGGSSFVYPGACHTRFSHSLGVAHLAGVLIDHLLSLDQNEYEIDKRDRACVKLAALCHDLGHGPFSHTFEVFVNRKRDEKGQPHWHHENTSLQLFDYLISENDIDLALYGLKLPEDVTFIKHLIRGIDEDEPWPTNIGRPPKKRFLFDIVANKRNGIDVDKLDYFVRDSISAMGDPPIGCDIQRLIKSSRVCVVGSDTAICFEAKMALSILDLFRLRAWLHKYLYQHHTVNLIEEMIMDALYEADDDFPLLHLSDGQRKISLSETVNEMSAFSRVGDWILQAIETSSSPNLEAARDILARLRSRQLYTLVNHPVELVQPLSQREIAKQILALTPETDRGQIERSLVVHVTSIDYGARKKDGTPYNPLLRVHFFNPKINCHRAYKIDEKKFPALFMPQTFGQRLVYVYSRYDDDDVNLILADAFAKWKDRYEHEILGNLSRADVSLTPVGTGNPQSPRRARQRLQRIPSRQKANLSSHGLQAPVPLSDDTHKTMPSSTSSSSSSSSSSS